MDKLSLDAFNPTEKMQIVDDVYEKEVLDIIEKLQSGQKNCFNVPECYCNDFRIVLAERKLRMRKVGLRGYDIIRNKFFVEEKLKTKSREKNITTWFEDFKSYYNYVEKKIYTKACYYQCDIPDCYGIKINLEKWNKCLSYSGLTVNDVKEVVEHSNRKYTREPLIPDDLEIDFSIEIYYSQGINASFNIELYWKRKDGRVVERRFHQFDYFFQAVCFLGGDFSGAHFLYCDGLINLKDLTDLNFENAILTSSVAEHLGVDFSLYSYPIENIKSFSVSCTNERETEMILTSNEHKYSFKDVDATHRVVRYISDIHIMHLLQNANVRSQNDLEYVLTKLARNLVGGLDPILIGGDVCSDYEIFKIFVEKLGRYKGDHQYVIFVLGNHELWPFPKRSIPIIVDTYRDLLNQNGMYLLHNEILFIDNDGMYMGKINRISYEELSNMDGESLDSRLVDSMYTFFGGIGFSGYDDKFNATKGIYRNVITRKEEILQTEIFESLYNKIVRSIPNRKVIVLTHMPMECWKQSVQYNDNFIYVSGHTHKNYFYDDGETRVYADNQIGYKGLNPHAKAFLVDISIDIFKNWEDGIYKITREQYYWFLVGMRRASSVSKLPYSLYMLKKSGYYCFIRETMSGGLSIIHGGISKPLKRRNIEQYYNEMDRVIKIIEKPLSEFSDYQKLISNEIKKIGGSGRIHGCIIDIDFYNHIYLNPNDLTVTGYYATDKVNKHVYTCIPALLKAQCPKLFYNLSELQDDSKMKVPVLYIFSKEELDTPPVIEYNTDIYKMSEVLNRMQRLKSNILTLWTEEGFEKELLELNVN